MPDGTPFRPLCDACNTKHWPPPREPCPARKPPPADETQAELDGLAAERRYEATRFDKH